MKRLEIRVYVDIKEDQTTADEVTSKLEREIDGIINGVVRRADLIDEMKLENR